MLHRENAVNYIFFLHCRASTWHGRSSLEYSERKEGEPGISPAVELGKHKATTQKKTSNKEQNKNNTSR